MATDGETRPSPLSDAAAYDWRVGHWSRAVGHAFVAWLDCPAGLGWLDVGCGAGALSRAILETGAPDRLAGIDPSGRSIATASAAIADPTAEFREAAAEALPFADGSFDVVVSGLALNFMADLPRAMAEMARVAVPGGWIAAYVWDFAGDMQVLRRYWDAAIEIDPGAREADQGRRFPLCHPEPLRRVFAEADLAETAVRALDVAAEFPDFDTYWHAITTGDGSTGRYAGSISETNRAALRDRLCQSLPLRADGRFRLNARAWAIRGKR